MLNRFSKNKLVFLLTILLSIVFSSALMSGCSTSNPTESAPLPKESGILTPASDGTKILVGSTVQVQSVHAASQNVTRVELWVKPENEATEKLVRADVPQNGIALQQWTPPYPGQYILKVRAWNGNNEAQADLVRQVQVLQSSAAALVGQKRDALNTSGESVSFGPPPAMTATPPPNASETEVVTQAAEVEIAVVHSESLPEPTGIPRYPAPPAAPGVPYGVTQAELNNFGPPVCDAAQYIGPYSSDTSRRIMIDEPDDVGAKVVAGTLVHRAWRLTNVGTCTWGPGYELAFYGGRSMGSGGVAFEETFPTNPPRRNVVVNTQQLIVPEGKPNQTAVLEVLLSTPTVPGIHQSYWRMRNPHGVFFGPIVGLTMEVVRECAFGIYGAPVINKFNILGVGNVYQPVDPARVQAEFGMPVTLEWDILNATNFDIVFESPTSEIESVSSTDASSRATFIPKNLGEHVITLYADNGSCTVSQQVKVEVVPPDNQKFTLDIFLPGLSTSSVRQAGSHVAQLASLGTDEVKAEWNHYDKTADQFTLVAETYRRVYSQYCPVVSSILGWKGHCYMTWSDWQPTNEKVALDVGKTAQGTATATNVERKLCPVSFDPTQERYGLRYSMRALSNGRAANPEYSNTVDVQCEAYSSSTPPTEIQGVRSSSFNPE